MVIQWTLCIFLVIYTLNKAFTYKVPFKTEQNVFERLFENMDKEQHRVIFFSENGHGDSGQNHELHHIKPYAVMGHGIGLSEVRATSGANLGRPLFLINWSERSVCD